MSEASDDLATKLASKQWFIISGADIKARQLGELFKHGRATVQHVIDFLNEFRSDLLVHKAEIVMQGAGITIFEPVYDMLIFCPACHKQHIDKAEQCRMCDGTGTRVSPSGNVMAVTCNACKGTGEWQNRPHKSHTCHYCNKVFRLADFCTNGVVAINTQGKDDTWQNVS